MPVICHDRLIGYVNQVVDALWYVKLLNLPITESCVVYVNAVIKVCDKIACVLLLLCGMWS